MRTREPLDFGLRPIGSLNIKTFVLPQVRQELRESEQLSEGDIEKRTGLLRCYISRVENNHKDMAERVGF
jgi:hypothetical protein